MPHRRQRSGHPAEEVAEQRTPRFSAEAIQGMPRSSMWEIPGTPTKGR
jgi:hypothetical protein